MLVSTLVPLALVLALGALAVGVVRARHRRNVGEPLGCSLPPTSKPSGGGCHIPCSFIGLSKGSGKAGWGKVKHTGTPNLH